MSGTTIRLDTSTRDRLKDIAKYGDSMDDVINKLIDGS